MIGSAGQACYAAANAFMDALALRRETMGLCGVSINWGAWSGAGMAADVASSVRTRWAARGFASISPEAGLEILARVLDGPPANIGVLPIAWDTYLAATYGQHVPSLFDELARRPAIGSQPPVTVLRQALEHGSVVEARPLLVNLVRAEIVSTLGLRSADAIDGRTSFFELGLDSLTATELRHRLRSTLGYEIGATTIFDYPSLDRLVDRLLEPLAGRTALVADAAAVTEPLVEPDDTGPDVPIEHAIADELERLEALMAGKSHE
jgi:acyl carrier protein